MLDTGKTLALTSLSPRHAPERHADRHATQAPHPTHTAHTTYAMAFRALVLVSLALVGTLQHVATAQVTDGCTQGAGATAANGFFTMGGACFAVMFGDAVDDPTDTCESVCTGAGLTCEGKSQRTAQDCADIFTAFKASPAKPADMPAQPDAGDRGYCALYQASNTQAWTETIDSYFMPLNSHLSCSQAFAASGSTSREGGVCECTLPDTTAPALSSITAVQASSSTVTVSGTTDEAGTMYCDVASSPGLPDTASSLKASGQTTTRGSAGSFTVTVTGVSGDGTKVASCVGEDAAGNLGNPPTQSSDFHFGALHTPCV